MSNRLLSMKFMQRKEAADSKLASPSTPTSERPSKRQRLSTGDAASPQTPSANSQAVQDTIAAEERKRQQVIDRIAAEAGETKWVLSVQQQPTPNTQTPIRVVTASYGAIDSGVSGGYLDDMSDDDEDEQQVTRGRPEPQGRRSFGRFNKTIERQTNPDLSSSEEEKDEDADSSASEESDSDDDDDPASVMIREQRRAASEKLRKERKAKRKSDQQQLEILAKERRKKEINLNREGGGISSGGRGNFSGGRGGTQADMACHQCGQKGHIKRDCPQPKHRSQGTKPGAHKRRSGLEYDY